MLRRAHVVPSYLPETMSPLSAPANPAKASLGATYASLLKKTSMMVCFKMDPRAEIPLQRLRLGPPRRAMPVVPQIRHLWPARINSPVYALRTGLEGQNRAAWKKQSRLFLF